MCLPGMRLSGLLPGRCRNRSDTRLAQGFAKFRTLQFARQVAGTNGHRRGMRFAQQPARRVVDIGQAGAAALVGLSTSDRPARPRLSASHANAMRGIRSGRRKPSQREINSNTVDARSSASRCMLR